MDFLPNKEIILKALQDAGAGAGSMMQQGANMAGQAAGAVGDIAQQRMDTAGQVASDAMNVAGGASNIAEEAFKAGFEAALRELYSGRAAGMPPSDTSPVGGGAPGMPMPPQM